MLNRPTCEELFNEELEEVARESDDGWRHGCYIKEVFYRKADDTYWAAEYCLSSDGESHGLREGLAEIYQVAPKQVTTTIYEAV